MKAGITVSVKAVVLSAVFGLVPVTVIVEALAVAPGAAVIVIAVLQVGLHEGDENAAVTPAGSGESEKVTAWVAPATRVAVTVVDADGPAAVTLTFAGLVASA